MQKKSDFVHLHVHTTFSLLDGLNHIEKLVDRAVELEFDTLAITDHGTLAGAFEFSRVCKKRGIKPIIGCEAYLAHETAQEPSGALNPTDHLLLLCQDEKGYRNLCELLTKASVPPYFHYKPRVDLELLSQHSEGLICSSACIQGPIARHLTKMPVYDRTKKTQVPWDQDVKKAIDFAGRLGEIFKGRFFVELMNHQADPSSISGMDVECCKSYEETMLMQQEILKWGVQVANAAGVPLLATNDAHFLTREDHAAHDAVMQISTTRDKKAGSKSRVLRSGLTELFLKSETDMVALFSSVPSAIKNTRWVADACNFEFKTGQFHLPKVDVPQGFKSVNHYMRHLTGVGFKERYPSATDLERKRARYEVAIIERMDVAAYMLVVAEFCTWARQKGILVGPGRGSAGGSIVAYCLGITDVDPIRHGLLFERFLNPDRVSMPDIDVDFEVGRRKEVIEHVREVYGRNQCAAISTFQSMKVRSSIQKVGELFGFTRLDLLELTRTFPPDAGEFRMTIEDLRREHKPLIDWVNQDKVKRDRMLDICERVDKTKSASSAHAAGIVIADRPIVEFMPTQVGSVERKRKDWDAIRFTHSPMDDLEDHGLLKVDALVIDCLDIIRKCREYIQLTQGFDFHFKPEWEETYDDAAVFRLVKSGRTTGVFQLDSDGMRKVCFQLQPDNFQQLAVVVALHRPGPMDYEDPETGLTMEQTYIHRKHGRQAVAYDHPLMEPILEDTFGVMVYQEQLTQIAEALCGYSYGQADKIRKATAKKKPKEVAIEKSKFIPAAIDYVGIDQALAELIWSKIETFGRYGFNRAHALAYGKLSYWTAYLKAHFPVEYMAALLTVDAEKTDKVRRYISECTRMGIDVLDPCVQRSVGGFIPEGESIRFGLHAISGIRAAAQRLVQIRGGLEEGRFHSFRGLVIRANGAGIQQAELERLIRAGACDDWGSRLGMLELLKALWKAEDRKKKEADKSVPLFETIEEINQEVDFRPKEKQMDHLKLLADCYSIDVSTSTAATLMRLGVRCQREDLDLIVDLVRTHSGRCPLMVRFPSEKAGDIVIQLGSVRRTQKLIEAFKKIRCEVFT
jgi:DNA polymerase-3 subunit alpha